MARSTRNSRPQPPGPRYTRSELSEALRMSPDTIAAAIDSGALIAYGSRGCWVYHSDLLAWLAPESRYLLRRLPSGK